MEFYLSLGQGLYYFITGIWALVSIETFMQVTGTKKDIWLVKTVGALVTVIGISLINTGFREDISPEAIILGAGCAFGLMMIDIIYVSKKIISKVYLLDAATELAILIAWLILII